MNRHRLFGSATAAPLVVLVAALGACGSAPPLDRAEVDRRLEGVGSPAAELVYVTEVAGYAVARQSVGVYGNDGFSSHYSSRDGAIFRLAVDRGVSECANPVVEGVAGAVSCEADGDLLYRFTPDAHEYARAEDGFVVRVGSRRSAADRETLRRAVVAAHRAQDSDLDGILPPQPAVPRAPTTRGDLPDRGDGAPLNPVGVGG
ncbi:MAG: hypothetical protein ACT4QF_20855 [Sporichthyaceae bacterium]